MAKTINTENELEDIERLADQIISRPPLVASEERSYIRPDTLLIPSGSVMLNLACSDHYRGAFTTGKMVNLIGDSSSGKSFMAFTILAEVCYSPLFSNYRLIYDDVEEACDFDIGALFGEGLASRIESPGMDKKTQAPVNSNTIQEFHMHIFDALDTKDVAGNPIPFIYVLDSFDALTSTQEQETVNANLKALREQKKASGSYGMEKPKILGQILRMIVGRMKESASLLLIVSQTRDNIDVMSFQKSTRSGGRALKFYASHEIWLANKGRIKKTTQGIERVIGNNVSAKVTKNKLTGKLRDAEYALYYDYGIDDVSAAIEFLIVSGHWKVNKNTILAVDFGIEASEAKLIEHIESNSLEKDLYTIVQNKWQGVEAAIKLKRKGKFGAKNTTDRLP
jgi:RecA/RadA recombinase